MSVQTPIAMTKTELLTTCAVTFAVSRGSTPSHESTSSEAKTNNALRSVASVSELSSSGSGCSWQDWEPSASSQQTLPLVIVVEREKGYDATWRVLHRGDPHGGRARVIKANKRDGDRIA